MTDSESDEERLDIGSINVEKANEASADELSESLVATDNLGVSLSVVFTQDLDDDTREKIFKIFEDNMKPMLSALPASSELVWNERKKRKQIFHQLSRFILVHNAKTRNLVGFALFRLEHEDEEDLLYIYDLQIAQSSRRAGIGACLMNCLSALCKKWTIEYMKLTVLRSNSAALAFYKKCGFQASFKSKEYSILFKEMLS